MVISTRALLQARLTHTRAALLEAFARVPEEMLGWAPVPGMRTTGGQIAEIVGTELQALARLECRPDVSWDEANRRIGDTTSHNSLSVALATGRAETLAYLESLSEADLAEPVSNFAGWHESVGLAEVPRSEIFRSIAQHEAYHTGQLISYLWARADDPYTW
ncbi:MAG: DinB family protein [Armatimonadetes bacterium]|nr:DinB family protein [Armatimonadota bacterium]MDE2206802.1 DinB family protein [Armatimonadota bacterium]